MYCIYSVHVERQVEIVYSTLIIMHFVVPMTLCVLCVYTTLRVAKYIGYSLLFIFINFFPQTVFVASSPKTLG